MKIFDTQIINLLKDKLFLEKDKSFYNFQNVQKVLQFVYALSYAFITIFLAEKKIHPFTGLLKTLAEEMLEIVKPFLILFVFNKFMRRYLGRTKILFVENFFEAVNVSQEKKSRKYIARL